MRVANVKTETDTVVDNTQDTQTLLNSLSDSVDNSTQDVQASIAELVTLYGSALDNRVLVSLQGKHLISEEGAKSAIFEFLMKNPAAPAAPSTPIRNPSSVLLDLNELTPISRMLAEDEIQTQLTVTSTSSIQGVSPYANHAPPTPIHMAPLTPDNIPVSAPATPLASQTPITPATPMTPVVSMTSGSASASQTPITPGTPLSGSISLTPATPATPATPVTPVVGMSPGTPSSSPAPATPGTALDTQLVRFEGTKFPNREAAWAGMVRKIKSATASKFIIDKWNAATTKDAKNTVFGDLTCIYCFFSLFVYVFNLVAD